jgi:hypothetical protein
MTSEQVKLKVDASLAWSIGLQLVALVFFFGTTFAKLNELDARLMEIRVALTKLEDRRETYAERFASLEQRVLNTERRFSQIP